MLTEATEQNLARKSHWADHVQMRDGIPLPSWIDISPIDACNRACTFCPRVDPAIAPNQPKLFMSLALGEKIAKELHDLEYEGAIVFCGTGEPLLHPQFVELVRCFKGLHVEVVTNGDRLSPKLIRELYDAGLSYCAVSLYDGVFQIDKFTVLFAQAGIAPLRYTLRDRWYDASNDFGLKLTNRAGTIDEGNQPAVDQHAPCFYPSYCMQLDWNGDCLLCPQDWVRHVKFGNVQQNTLLDCWNSRAMNKRRKQLLRGRSGLSPCQDCNAVGTLHGSDHVEAWGNGATKS